MEIREHRTNTPEPESRIDKEISLSTLGKQTAAQQRGLNGAHAGRSGADQSRGAAHFFTILFF